MKFYRNPKTGEVRIVKQLTPKAFVVVKLINNSTYTVKFWRGDLTRTASYWNTLPIEPSPEQVVTWTNAYRNVMKHIRPLFLKV
jgi:hypothetical protein